MQVQGRNRLTFFKNPSRYSSDAGIDENLADRARKTHGMQHPRAQAKLDAALGRRRTGAGFSDTATRGNAMLYEESIADMVENRASPAGPSLLRKGAGEQR